MPHRLPKRLAALFLLACSLALPLRAQPTDTAHVALSPGTALDLGGLLHTDAHLGRDQAPNGFTLKTARLKLNGTVHRAHPFIQVDVTRSPALLDAGLRLPMTEALSLTAGRFKAPFSYEALTSSSRLLFLSRARVVDVLAPARQTGVSVEAALLPDRLSLAAGLFNGNGAQAFSNDNDALLYVTRLVGTAPLDGGTLQFGLNVGYSEDAAVGIPPIAPAFAGRRALFGADVVLERRAWLFVAEGITASLDETNGPTYRPTGYAITAGYRPADAHQVLLRLDAFDPDLAATDFDEQLVVGYTFSGLEALRMQVNYTAAFDALEDGFVGARLQLAF